MWHTVFGWVSLCQFRDNILIATDADPSHRATLIEQVRTVLKKCSGLEVECSCITKQVLHCTGQCCAPETKQWGR